MLAQVPEGSPLLDIVWIGPDVVALSEMVEELVPERASRVGLYSTLFKSHGPYFEAFKEEYFERFGKAPYQYGLNAYDALWVIALSYYEVYEELGTYDPDRMAEVIPEVTRKYSEGQYEVETVSGYIELDEWNDRAIGDYAIYAMVEGKWEHVALWDFETRVITWY